MNEQASGLEVILAPQRLKYLSKALAGTMNQLVMDGQGHYESLFENLISRQLFPPDGKTLLDVWHKQKSIGKTPFLSSTLQ